MAEDSLLRLFIQTVLRFVAAAYFALTSLYCLLAYLPYTYTAFIKAPPYPWMPWFAHHQALLFWLAAIAGVVGAEDAALRERARARDPRLLLPVGLLAAIGVYLGVRPFLPALQSDRTAYWWSIASLLPVIGFSLWRSPAQKSNGATSSRSILGYSSGVLVAVVVSMIYMIGSRWQVYQESHSLRLQKQFADIALWSLVSHIAVAMAVLSALNLIYFAASKTRAPRAVRRWLVGLSIVAGLWIVTERFLDTAMSFDGWSAYVFALMFAVSLTLWGFALASPFNERAAPQDSRPPLQVLSIWIVMGILIVLALMSRTLIGGEDWNGFVASTWALIFWTAMSLCVYRLRPVRVNYSVPAIVGILLASAFSYKSLQFTQIFWSQPLGSTEDEISLTLEEYGGHDASFLLAHHVLGNGRQEGCRDLCRILREYTNIRETHIRQGVKLVDSMTPTQDERPNVFIFVIDSMRADYLGAYNPKVDYTPHLDALASDSIVFHRTYTQYAGTSISEPAIWAGAELLHTHFPQPFDEVNSLRTLAKTDGYELVASYDTVLRQLFTAADDLTKLDTDKDLWNRYEACSTASELESHLDSRQDKSRPVFFYAQPMNVHQFARNDVPSPTSQHWPDRPGLSTRITYEVHWVDSCLGGFFDYLKQRHMYDNSIIIVTSDHGDATGEFGRMSHSTSIWPEIMRVPLIIHLPTAMRQGLVYDDTRLSKLTDIAPTLCYLLGHRPIRQNPLYGRPLLMEKKEELDSYPKRDLLLASDVRAVYGILSADGRSLYTTYDSPAQSYLFDLVADPNAQHDILTAPLKQRYDEQIIERLQLVGDYYGYKPGVGSLLASTTH